MPAKNKCLTQIICSKPQEIDGFPFLEPIYPLTQGLAARTVQRTIGQALTRIPQLQEWQDPTWLAKQGWDGFNTALKSIHKPAQENDIALNSTARQRLAFDELLAMQLALALVRRDVRHQKGRVITGDGTLRAKIIEALAFQLTQSQQRTLKEIEADLGSTNRMLRLLQGDVGSGKTIVAVLSMAIAIEAGFQSALMAPTEILARQHLHTLQPLAERAGIRIALLTGAGKGQTARTNMSCSQGGVD